MGLNVDSITLSEYRITQDPVRQEILADAIVRPIFEDGYFSPEEGETLQCLMKGLDEYKKNSLKEALNYYRSDQIKVEFQRQFLSRLASWNEEVYGFHWVRDIGWIVDTEKMETPTAIMRENFDPEGSCEARFNGFTSTYAVWAIQSAFEAVYGGELSTETYLGILGNMDRRRIELPEWGLQYFHYGLCRDLAFYCPTFECEGLNTL